MCVASPLAFTSRRFLLQQRSSMTAPQYRAKIPQPIPSFNGFQGLQIQGSNFTSTLTITGSKFSFLCTASFLIQTNHIFHQVNPIYITSHCGLMFRDICRKSCSCEEVKTHKNAIRKDSLAVPCQDLNSRTNVRTDNDIK